MKNLFGVSKELKTLQLRCESLNETIKTLNRTIGIQESVNKQYKAQKAALERRLESLKAINHDLIGRTLCISFKDSLKGVFDSFKSSDPRKSMVNRTCAKCGGSIKKKELYINHQVRYNGKILVFSFHEECYH